MDMLGKKQFQIGEKYYFEDLGIRNAIRSFRVTERNYMSRLPIQ